MIRPEHGLCVPVKVIRVYDGDTVHVRLYDPEDKREGLKTWHVRLLDCWAPEVKGPEREDGLKAKAFLEDLLRDEEDVSVFVPRQPKANILDAMTTMGRVLGRLFIGSQDVSEVMVRHGYATKAAIKKPK